MLRHLAAGTPACVTVSHLDSLVLARSGFNHSADYRSAMRFGTARLVTDPEAKREALVATVDRFSPGRTARLRPATPQEVTATAVVAMEIEEASSKIRDRGLLDDPEDFGHPVWAGGIPVRTVLGPAADCPEPAPDTPRPEGLADYRADRRLDAARLETQAEHDRAG